MDFFVVQRTTNNKCVCVYAPVYVHVDIQFAYTHILFSMFLSLSLYV